MILVLKTGNQIKTNKNFLQVDDDEAFEFIGICWEKIGNKRVGSGRKGSIIIDWKLTEKRISLLSNEKIKFDFFSDGTFYWKTRYSSRYWPI
jgi:hypothetical protein